MKRNLFALAAPPLAVCRYGCASCCAAPIGVFWITGIVSLIYGYFGGPLGGDHVSWATMGLGVVLWAIASVWAVDTIKSVDEDQRDPNCDKQVSNLCRIVRPRLDESDPFDEIKKFR